MRAHILELRIAMGPASFLTATAAALVLLHGASARKYNTAAGRRSEAGILNVHVIAHTHGAIRIV